MQALSDFVENIKTLFSSGAGAENKKENQDHLFPHSSIELSQLAKIRSPELTVHDIQLWAHQFYEHCLFIEQRCEPVSKIATRNERTEFRPDIAMSIKRDAQNLKMQWARQRQELDS